MVINQHNFHHCSVHSPSTLLVLNGFVYMKYLERHQLEYLSFLMVVSFMAENKPKSFGLNP